MFPLLIMALNVLAFLNETSKQKPCAQHAYSGALRLNKQNEHTSCTYRDIRTGKEC